MTEIKIPNECEEHKKKIYNICLDKNCKKRYLCVKCFSTHDQTHTKNFVPINEFINDNNKIILFDDYIQENEEISNKIQLIKEEAIKEINKILDDIKIQVAKKMDEMLKNYQTLQKLKDINKLFFDELINLYNTINQDNIKVDKENEIVKLPKK